MSRSGQTLRLRLDLMSYERRHDDWRCRSCCMMSNPEVHHREFRRHSGADSDENLITSVQHAMP
jgi:hypothetical protein